MTKDQGPGVEERECTGCDYVWRPEPVSAPTCCPRCDSHWPALAQPLNDRPLPSVGWRVVPEALPWNVSVDVAPMISWPLPNIYGEMDRQEQQAAIEQIWFAALAHPAAAPPTSEVPSAWRDIEPTADMIAAGHETLHRIGEVDHDRHVLMLGSSVGAARDVFRAMAAVAPATHGAGEGKEMGSSQGADVASPHRPEVPSPIVLVGRSACEAVRDAYTAGFHEGMRHKAPWDDMHDYCAVIAQQRVTAWRADVGAALATAFPDRAVAGSGGIAATKPQALCEPKSSSPDLREQVAAVVAQAVNMALAGVKAPGRCAPDCEAATYYADRILALTSGGSNG